MGKSKKESKEGKGREGEVRKRRCEYMHVSGMYRSVWGFCFFWVGEERRKNFLDEVKK